MWCYDYQQHCCWLCLSYSNVKSNLSPLFLLFLLDNEYDEPHSDKSKVLISVYLPYLGFSLFLPLENLEAFFEANKVLSLGTSPKKKKKFLQTGGLLGCAAASDLKNSKQKVSDHGKVKIITAGLWLWSCYYQNLLEKKASFGELVCVIFCYNMERQSSSTSRGAVMERQQSFHGVVLEKQASFGKGIEKQKSFRGFMDKQKSFRIVMEKQLSFIGGDRNKKNKDSPGKRGDLQIHLAARAGNLARIRDILHNCSTKESVDLLSRTNQEGETPLYVAAENGHSLLVAEMLKYMDLQTASLTARNGYDPFHIAARQGHLDVLKELLHLFPNLAMTTDLSNSTALHTAATQGHIEIVNLLLETDSNLVKIARNNGKTVLHSAARMGHLEVVKSLLSKDPSTGFRTDKKGQTALHMAVKGQNEEIVLELVKPDPKVLSLEDNKGNTALHIATRKGRIENVRCLLSIEGGNINAINKAGETPLDIAEKFGTPELASVLKEAGATNSTDQGKPPNAAKQLKQTVSDIKHDVQSQLQQTRQTGARVQKIAKRLKKLHISGLNNAINSSIVVAVLIATVAFAAIFTVPGQFVEEETPRFTLGQAHIARNAAFIIFFVFDSLALFISLAVVVVQTSVVVIEQKAKRQLVFVINKLMWLACLFISIAFISLTYIVVGSHNWLAVYTTVIGGSIMLTTIGSMCYCVILHRMEETKLRNIRKAESRSRSFSVSMAASDSEILNSEYKRMYAL